MVIRLLVCMLMSTTALCRVLGAGATCTQEEEEEEEESRAWASSSSSARPGGEAFPRAPPEPCFSVVEEMFAPLC